MAVLLEIARVLGEHPPPIGVDIVFFDGEDYGEEGIPQDYILGSTYFANNLRGYRPSAVVIVDMIGERNTEIPIEGYSRAASPELVDEIYSIAEKMDAGSFRREDGPAIIDDHFPFIQVGIPAVDLIDFDYAYWHTLEDTPDKCSPGSLGDVGKVLLSLLWGRE